MNILKRAKEKGKGIKAAIIIAMTSVVTSSNVYAGELSMDEGLDSWSNVMGFIAGWAARIGMGVAFVALIYTIYSMGQDNPDGKKKGLLFLGMSLAVVAAAKSYESFIV